MHSIFPIALYQCCTGYVRTAQELLDGTQEWNDADNNYQVVKLSADNLLACLAAWESLKTTQALTTFAWADLPTTTYYNCTSWKKCAAIRKNTLLDLFYPDPIFAGLMTWKALQDNQFTGSKMCSLCIAIAEQMHNKGRGEFWDELPRSFGFDGWDELRAW